jgi:hypothetical protein
MPLTATHPNTSPPVRIGSYELLTGRNDPRRRRPRGLPHVRAVAHPASNPTTIRPLLSLPPRLRTAFTRLQSEHQRFARRMGWKPPSKPRPPGVQRPALLAKRSSSPHDARALLDAAALQQAVASTRWAPILEFGTAGTAAAYYVTREYDASVASLLHTAARLDDRAIAAITGGVIRGLLDFRRATGRSHGNLKPSNVLIRAARRGIRATALTDPSPAPQLDPAAGERNDLHALGHMLRNLIRPATEPLYPAAAQVSGATTPPRWVKPWLAFCDRLTDPLAPSRLTRLDDAAAECRRLARAGRTSRLVASLTTFAAISATLGFLLAVIRSA